LGPRRAYGIAVAALSMHPLPRHICHTARCQNRPICARPGDARCRKSATSGDGARPLRP